MEDHISETDDTLIIEDEQGNETTYTIDAIIEMNNKKYVLYSHGDELQVSQIIEEAEEEVLQEVSDEEMDELLSAYQEALTEEEQA